MKAKQGAKPKKITFDLTPTKKQMRKSLKKDYASLSPIQEGEAKKAKPAPPLEKEFKESDEDKKKGPSFSISELLDKAKPFVPSLNSKRSVDISSESEPEQRPILINGAWKEFKSFELSDSLVFDVSKKASRDQHYAESILASTQGTDSVPYHSDYDPEYFFYPYEEEYPLPGKQVHNAVFKTKVSRSRDHSSVSSVGRYERMGADESSDEEMREIVRREEADTIKKFKDAGVTIQRFSEAQQEEIYNRRLEKQRYKRNLALGGEDLLMTPVVKQFET